MPPAPDDLNAGRSDPIDRPEAMTRPAAARPDPAARPPAGQPGLAAQPTPEHPGPAQPASNGRNRDLAQAEVGGSPAGVPRAAEPDMTGGWSDLMGDTMDLTSRWSAIQAGFVDEPRRAVEEARDLVGEVVGRLTSSFERESQRLESRWSSGGQVDTEDLRMVLRHYRTAMLHYVARAVELGWGAGWWGMGDGGMVLFLRRSVPWTDPLCGLK